MTTFGDAVAAARRPRNQQWLAEQMQVTQSAVSDWERDRRFPRPETIPQLEQVLGLPAGFLVALRTGVEPHVATAQSQGWSVDPDAIEGARHLSPEDRQMVADLVARLIVASGVDPLHPPRPEDGRDDV